MTTNKQPPLIHGIILISGGAIGAGMFALPIVSAGTGFVWAAFGLILVWAITYLASLFLLQVNSRFEPGASFNTLVASTLGKQWASINNLAIAFIMYILMYAYITAGASILDYTLSTLTGESGLPSRGYLSLMVTVVVALVVGLGSGAVSRFSGSLLGAMVVCFVLAQLQLLPMASPLNLISNADNVVFLAAAVPVYVAAFACAGMVPSLLKHYRGDALRVKRCLFFGTLTSLVIYALWLISTLGVLTKPEFSMVIDLGGSTGDLVAALEQSGSATGVGRWLTLFSHMAILTSFFSIGLGLFDFVLDRFNLDGSGSAKFKAVVVTFLPPAVMSFFLPYGFVKAIGYAGLVVMFSFFFIPTLMWLKTRGAIVPAESKSIAPSHMLYVWTVLVFTIVVTGFKILSSLYILPTFS